MKSVVCLIVSVNLLYDAVIYIVYCNLIFSSKTLII